MLTRLTCKQLVVSVTVISKLPTWNNVWNCAEDFDQISPNKVTISQNFLSKSNLASYVANLHWICCYFKSCVWFPSQVWHYTSNRGLHSVQSLLCLKKQLSKSNMQNLRNNWVATPEIMGKQRKHADNSYSVVPSMISLKLYPASRDFFELSLPTKERKHYRNWEKVQKYFCL